MIDCIAYERYSVDSYLGTWPILITLSEQQHYQRWHQAFCFHSFRTDNSYGRVQLSVDVEERKVLHLRERLVRVGVVGGSLDTSPAPDLGVHPDDGVQDEAMIALKMKNRLFVKAATLTQQNQFFSVWKLVNKNAMVNLLHNPKMSSLDFLQTQ